jgi:hypothetical protein
MTSILIIKVDLVHTSIYNCANTSTIHHNQSLLLKTTLFFLYITYTDSNQQKISYYYEKEIFANKLHQIFD